MSERADLRVRDALPGEEATIRALTLRSYAEYASIMTPTAWAGLEQAVLTALSTPDAAERIVAEMDDGLVGSVRLYPASTNAYHGAVDGIAWPEVRLLAVAPEARGKGVAAALMDECIRRARLAGASELGLHTSDSMKVAIRIYEQMGFERAPEHDFQPPGAELVKAYRLRLDHPPTR